MTEPRIIQKVIDLINLAEGKGATTGEAANAAAAAQALMERHKLTRAAVQAAVDADGQPDSGIREDPEPFWTGGKHVSWRRRLANGIARCNDCRVAMSVSTKRGPAGMWFIGHAEDTEVARYLYAYLSREIARLASKAVDVNRGALKNPRTWANNFRLGAAYAVIRRLQQARAKTRQQAMAELNVFVANGAMIRLNARDNAVERWTHDHMKKRHCTTSGATFDINGRTAGMKAGVYIPLRDALKEPAT